MLVRACSGVNQRLGGRPRLTILRRAHSVGAPEFRKSISLEDPVRRSFFLFALSLLLCVTLASAAAAQVDPEMLAGMKARSIGPAGMSGRSEERRVGKECRL